MPKIPSTQKAQRIGVRSAHKGRDWKPHRYVIADVFDIDWRGDMRRGKAIIDGKMRSVVWHPISAEWLTSKSES